jgi:hypothetical protein
MSAFLIGFIAGCIAAAVLMHFYGGGGDPL